jgi:DNA polymerase-3 subunit alpha
MPVTQFNMKWVEAAGLVKFDFLGLKTLTVLAARRASSSGQAWHPDRSRRRSRSTIAKTYAHAGARRDGRRVPGGIARACARRCVEHAARTGFEDIIALVALYRPGPMANIPDYIARKHGEQPGLLSTPSSKPILKETYGVIIYQEQVMQIAQVLSGYSLGEADLLRRAMGKKIRRRWTSSASRFVRRRRRAAASTRPTPTTIFDLLAQIRRLRLQQEPCRGLRARRLPDRLHEGELPGRVPGRRR